MGIGNVIKIMKEIHPQRVIMVKIGTFYHEYGRDAYIISYLFGYQIHKTNQNLEDCGFPKSALNKVIKQLEDNEIDYMIINKAENYEVQEEMEFKKDNKYKLYYDKAHKYISKKTDAMYNYLVKNKTDEIIQNKMEKFHQFFYIHPTPNFLYYNN